MSDKLPAFPAIEPDGGEYDLWGTIQWLQRDRDACRARMEALKPYAQHADDCEKWDPENEGLSDTLQCDCGLDALLAACERDEGER